MHDIILDLELNVSGFLCKLQVQGLNSLFGEYLTRCLYSKTWSLREAAVLKVIPPSPPFGPRVVYGTCCYTNDVDVSFYEGIRDLRCMFSRNIRTIVRPGGG